MEYKCSKCGKVHDEWPALGFTTPDQYHELSEEEKDKVAEISEDFCVIKYEDQTDRFIRCVLFQEVNDCCQNLEYGVWVSVSEKSFNEYKSFFQSGDNDAVYFGYLCSQIPEYEDTLGIKMNVVVSQGDNRPEVIPHDDQMDDPFVKDYYEGISKEEAEQRIKSMVESN